MIIDLNRYKKTKQLVLFDTGDVRDHCSLKRTEVTMTQKINGVDTIVGTIFEKKQNKVILPGAEFSAQQHFDIPRDFITPSYNTALELENSVVETPSSEEKVYLFCLGTDGCGVQNSDVYNEDYSKWIAPEYLVPFRYVKPGDDLSGSLREMYFGRKVDRENERVAYYFKAFETDPVCSKQYVDGTPIDSTIYTNAKTDEVETVVTLSLKVLAEDCRDWFNQTTGINDARVNTISLCYAWAKTYDGQIYYQDIRPLTKLNFPNEPLIDLTKELDITYALFY